MIEGKLDRPEQNHLLAGLRSDVDDIVSVGNKFVPLVQVKVLSDVTPPTSPAAHSLASWIPVGAVAVNLAIYLYAPGLDTWLSVSDNGANGYYQLICYSASEITYPISNAGIMMVDGSRNISYRCNRAAVSGFDLWLGGYWIPMGQTP